MNTRKVSSGQVFKLLTVVGRKGGQGMLTAPEVKVALDSFKWGDGQVTRTEVLAARKEFKALQQARLLTADGEKAFSDWFKDTGAGARGGFTAERAAVTFDTLESFFRFDPESASGARLSKAEAEVLVELVGEKASPARIADLLELLPKARASGSTKEALNVLKDYAFRNPMPAPGEPLATALQKPLTGLLWPSETDRPVYAVSLGTAPSSRRSPVNALREALGESKDTPVEVRDFQETFARLTAVDDPGDPAAVKRARQFSAVRAALTASLTDLKVLRVGTTDIDVYVLGKDSSGRWVGVMSGVVET
jgi:hypothetical protein